MSDAQQSIDSPTAEQQAMLDEVVDACKGVVNEDNPCSTVRRVLPDASVLLLSYHLEDGLSLEALEGEEFLAPSDQRYFDPDQDNTNENGEVITPPFDTDIFKGAA